jgi:hypothetical protein
MRRGLPRLLWELLALGASRSHDLGKGGRGGSRGPRRSHGEACVVSSREQESSHTVISNRRWPWNGTSAIAAAAASSSAAALSSAASLLVRETAGACEPLPCRKERSRCVVSYNAIINKSSQPPPGSPKRSVSAGGLTLAPRSCQDPSLGCSCTNLE